VFDQHGIFNFRGRIKEMIKTGGINVTAADVEELLEEHPAIRQAIVVGVPDTERDEIVAAMVVLREGARATTEELMAYAASQSPASRFPASSSSSATTRCRLTDTSKVSKRLVQEKLTATYAAQRE